MVGVMKGTAAKSVPGDVGVGLSAVIGTRLFTSRTANERKRIRSPTRDLGEKEMKKDRRKSSNHSLKGRHRDHPRLVGEFAPGRKGGRYEFPFGGHMTVDGGVVSNKKDTISCTMVAPSERYKYAFDLKPYEVFVSEFFEMRLTFTTRSLKHPVHMRLPIHEAPYPSLTEYCVRQRSLDGTEWTETEFTTVTSTDGQLYVDLSAPRSAVFVVTSRPKTDRFEVPVQGCLHNSNLSMQISLRFPKKATDVCITCDIQIMTMDRANFVQLAKEYPIDMLDMVACTDYIDISTSVAAPFRRDVTVKLPLPALEDDNFPQSDIVIMLMVDGEWQLLDTPIKFTKSAITFDTKTLGRYCVCLCRPQRRKRMKETFRHIQEDERAIRGEILVFVHVEEKLWNLYVEAVPRDHISAVVIARENEGLQHVTKSFIAIQPDVVESTVRDQMSRRNSTWRQRHSSMSNDQPKKVEREDIDLVSGRVFELQLSGDVRMCGEGAANTGLRFDERLPESGRHFSVEPTSKDECRPLVAQLRCFSPPVDGAGTTTCVRTFDIEFELEAVKAYLDWEDEEITPEVPTTSILLTAEPIIPPRIVIDNNHVHVKVVTTPRPEPQQKRNSSVYISDHEKQIRNRAVTFARLTKAMKPPREAIRESKVLTGRSLACLAREIEQGLTLAIYLGISDSTITGMGFDALANGQNLVDITYRILLLWKRRSHHYKNKQADLLADALNDMGRSDVAAVIMDHHRQNIELTPNCFVAGA